MIEVAVMGGIHILTLVMGSSGHASQCAEAASTEEAISAIRQLGGQVAWNQEHSRRRMLSIWFTGSKATDDVLEHLRGLTEIKRLSLAGSRVTDGGMEHLKG